MGITAFIKGVQAKVSAKLDKERDAYDIFLERYGHFTSEQIAKMYRFTYSGEGFAIRRLLRERGNLDLIDRAAKRGRGNKTSHG